MAHLAGAWALRSRRLALDPFTRRARHACCVYCRTPTLPSPRAPSVGRVRRAAPRRTPRGPAEPGANFDAPALTVWGDDQANALTDAVADIPHDEWLALGRALLARGLSEEEQRARARVDALCAAHRLAYTAWLVRDAIETGGYVGRGRPR